MMKTVPERGHYNADSQPILNWEKDLIGRHIRWTDEHGTHEGEIVARVKHFNARNVQAGFDFCVKCGETERVIRPYQLREAEVI